MRVLPLVLLLVLPGCVGVHCGDPGMRGAHWRDAGLFAALASVPGAVLTQPPRAVGAFNATGNVTGVQWNPPRGRVEHGIVMDFGPGLARIVLHSGGLVEGQADNRTPAALVAAQFRAFAANLTGRPASDFRTASEGFAANATWDGARVAVPRPGGGQDEYALLHYTGDLPAPLDLDGLAGRLGTTLPNGDPVALRKLGWDLQLEGPTRQATLTNGDVLAAAPGVGGSLQFGREVPRADAEARVQADFAALGLPAPADRAWDYGPTC